MYIKRRIPRYLKDSEKKYLKDTRDARLLSQQNGELSALTPLGTEKIAIKFDSTSILFKDDNTVFVCDDRSIKIVDISDSSFNIISAVTNYLPDGSTNPQTWDSIYHDGYIYRTRPSGGAGSPVVIIYDVNNIEHPFITGWAIESSFMSISGIAINNAGTLMAIVANQALRLYDITNKSNPKLVSVTVNATYFTNNTQAIAFSNDDTYIYVIGYSGPTSTSRLTIYDVTSPITPSFVYSNNLTIGGYIRDIEVYSSTHLIVVGYQRCSVINVSNPAAPTISGQLFYAPLIYGTRFVRDGNYLYVASYGTRPVSIIIFDITNINSPTYFDSFSDGIISNGSVTFKNIGARNGRLILGDYQGTGVVMYDVSDPSDPTLLDFNGGYQFNPALEWDNNIILAGGGSTENTLVFFDISNNSFDRISRYSIVDPAPPTSIYGIARYNNLLYTNNNSLGSYQVTILDLSDINDIQLVGSLTDSGIRNGRIITALPGGWAAVPAYNNFGIGILDIRDPSNPVVDNTLDFTGVSANGFLYDIEYHNGYLYVFGRDYTDYDTKLVIVDVRDPTNPTIVDTLVCDILSEFKVHNQRLYLFTSYTEGWVETDLIKKAIVQVIDVSDPENLTLIQAFKLSNVEPYDFFYITQPSIIDNQIIAEISYGDYYNYYIWRFLIDPDTGMIEIVDAIPLVGDPSLNLVTNSSKVISTYYPDFSFKRHDLYELAPIPNYETVFDWDGNPGYIAKELDGDPLVDEFEFDDTI